MVTTVANSLFDRLIEAFPPNRPYGRSDLRRGPMPECVGAYLEHLLEVKLRSVVTSDPPEDVWVDIYAPEVEEARIRYIDVMERHQAVPAREWADTLRTACHDVVRYLVRPASTLTDAVFGTADGPADADRVFERVDYYTGYSYFRNVIEAYFDQRGVVRIDRERFEGLVRRTDRQMTGDFSAQQWLRLIEPLVEILTAAGEKEIPLELLKAFLDEKGAEGPLRRLKRRFGLDGFVPVGELEAVFEGDERSDRRAQPPEVRRSPERPVAERSEGPVPLWKQFEHGGRPAEREARVTEVQEPEAPVEPLWKQFRKPSAAPARSDGRPSSLNDLERLVLGDRGAPNRDLFVKHLFAGRSEEYEATLKRLAQAASWSQASQIIAQDVFLKHQVNIYSDPAVAFTDAAEAQYRS